MASQSAPRTREYELSPDRLCSACARNDMATILPGRQKYGIHYVLRDHASDCTVCEFLRQCLPARTGVHNARPDAQLESAPLSDLLRDVGGVTLEGRLQFPRENIFTNYLELKTGAHTPRTLSSMILHFQPASWTGIAPTTPLIDFGMVNKWIKEENCERCDTTSHLTVIDCTTRSLVMKPEGAIYLALSYVWGSEPLPVKLQVLQASLNRLKRFTISKNAKISLPRRLPQTIEDSITVCKAVHCRYLWSDRYCITQDDKKMRAADIRRMDQIYSNAYITLVACAGSDPSYGLPGVSRPRQECPALNLGTRGYLQMIPTVRDVYSSIWATRGWTYQEALLSGRLLYFTDRQLYFELNHRVKSELTTRDFLGPVLKLNARDRIYARDAVALTTQSIADDIAMYSHRELTYPADILKALTGVFHFYESRAHINQLWGLPFSASGPHYQRSDRFGSYITLSESLQWTSTADTYRRRTGFPSWSWAGWYGSIEFGHAALRFQSVSLPSLTVAPTSRSLDESDAVSAFEVEVELESGELLRWSMFQARYEELVLSAQNYRPHKNQMTAFIHVEAHAAPSVYSWRSRRSTDGHQEVLGVLSVIVDAINGETVFLTGAEEADHRAVEAIGESIMGIEKVALDSYAIIFFDNSYAKIRHSSEVRHFALLIKDHGDFWERVALLEDRRKTIRPLKRVRRKFRLG